MTKSIKDTLRLNNAINSARAKEAWENRKDPTEDIRRTMIATGYPEVQAEFAEKQWTTAQLQEEFIVESFLAPFVVVTRKADNVKGSMMFKHSPRVYFNFTPDM